MGPIPYELNLWICSLSGGACVALAACLVWRWRTRRRQRAVCSRLGTPVPFDEASATEGFVALSGVIDCQGVPTPRIEDGAPASVTTAAVRAGRRPARWYAQRSASASGEGLVLRSGGQPIAIRGPVELLLGSSERSLRRPLRRTGAGVRRRAEQAGAGPLQDSRLTLRSVAPGERVVVLGHLSRRPVGDGLGTYRAPAHRWTLTGSGLPGVTGGSVLMAYAGRFGLTLDRLAVLAVAVIASSLVGLGVGWAGDAEQHRCSASVVGPVPWSLLNAQADAACRQTFACRVFGQCTSVLRQGLRGHVEHECVARTNADCVSSRNCRLHGQCQADAAFCFEGGPSSHPPEREPTVPSQPRAQLRPSAPPRPPRPRKSR